MKEAFPSNEGVTIEKQAVIDSYKKIINKGVTSPDSMDLEDSDVITANK